MWKKRQELMKKRQEQDDAKKIKLLKLQEKRQMEKEKREKLRLAQQEKNLKIKEVELGQKAKRNQFITYLEALQYLFEEDLESNYLHSMIKQTRYVYESRIANIHPKYDSV